MLEDGGYTVEVKPVENRELYAPELESGSIDVVPEYAATFTEFLNLDENGPDAEPVATGDVDETVEALRPLAEEKGLEVLEPAEAANQNAFFVTEDFATRERPHDAVRPRRARPADRAGRDAGVPRAARSASSGSSRSTGSTSPRTCRWASAACRTSRPSSRATRSSACPARPTARSADLGLVVLEDDKQLQNADNLVPVVNAEGPAGTDEVAEVLNGLSETLTTEDLAELNRRVDEDREQAADVAAVLPRGAGPARGLTCALSAQHALAHRDLDVEDVARRGEGARPGRVVRARRVVGEVQVEHEPARAAPPRSAPLTVSSR